MDAHLCRGWVGCPAEAWKVFSRRWSAVLRANHVKEFHTADLMARRGEFRGWDQRQVDELWQRCSSIIDRYVPLAVGTAVHQEDYESVVASQLAKGDPYRNPYIFCMLGCLQRMGKNHRRLLRLSPTNRIAITYDRESKLTGHITDVVNEVIDYYEWGDLFTRSTVPGDSEELEPLQAADYFAHRALHYTEKFEIGGKRFPTRLLVPHVTVDGGYQTANTLQDFVDQLKTARANGLGRGLK